jgi:hypothetical protein
MLVNPVRVIGGPTGGRTGPRGPIGARQSLLFAGPTGIAGATGLVGLTGYVGPTGLASLLVGMMGAPGPSGDSQVTGATGPTGWNIMVPAANTAYFENTLGLTVGISGYGSYVGCKFFYTIKGGGQFVAIMTGDWTPSAGDKFWTSIAHGTPPAPNPGDQGLGLPGNVSSFEGVEIKVPIGCTIPFTVVDGPYLGQDQNRVPGQEYWFDLQATGKGTVKNICCAILEF